MISVPKKKLDLDIRPIRHEMDIGSIVWLWMVEEKTKESNGILDVVLNAIEEHGVSVTEKETFVPRPKRMPVVNSKGSLRHDKFIVNPDPEKYMEAVRRLIPIWGYQDVPYGQSQNYEYEMDLLTKADLEDGIGIGDFVSCFENAKSWIDGNYPEYDFDVLKAGWVANRYVNLDDLINALNKDGIGHPYMCGKITKNNVVSEKNNSEVVELSPDDIAKNGGHEMEDYKEFRHLCILKDLLRLRNGDYKIYGMGGGDSWKSFYELKEKIREEVLSKYYGIKKTNAGHIWRIVVEEKDEVPGRVNIIHRLKEIKNLLWEEDTTTIFKTWFKTNNDYRMDLHSKIENFPVQQEQWRALVVIFKPITCIKSNKNKIADESDFDETAIALKNRVERILSDDFLDGLFVDDPLAAKI